MNRPASTQPFIPGSQRRPSTRWQIPAASCGQPQPDMVNLQPHSASNGIQKTRFQLAPLNPRVQDSGSFTVFSECRKGVSQGWLTSAARRNASATPPGRAEKRRTPAMPMTPVARRKRKQPHRFPVIPGGVKRRPGIHAEALDSRFRGNDGGQIQRAWEHADRDRTSCLASNTCSPTNAEASAPPHLPSRGTRQPTPGRAGKRRTPAMPMRPAEREKETTSPLPHHSGRSETETRNPCQGTGFPLSRE